MKKVGMRKGKRRAIQTLGEITRVTGKKPCHIDAKKLYGKQLLFSAELQKPLEKGLVYMAIAPFDKELASPSARPFTLSAIKNEKNKMHATFESPVGKIIVTLDDRGRAKKLEAGKEYILKVMTRKEFFERYERGSIPVRRKGRSEPEEIGRERIKNFAEMAGVKKGERVLDAATGIKGYLKKFAEKGALVCTNISPTMLKRTREWLASESATFIAYDVEKGFPFKDETFDVVICDALLEYVSNPHKVLRDACRIVKKGGRMLLLEPVESKKAQDFYPQDMWEVALWRPRCDPSFSAAAFENTMRKYGFKMLEKRKMKFKYPLYKVERFAQSIARLQKPFI